MPVFSLLMCGIWGIPMVLIVSEPNYDIKDNQSFWSFYIMSSKWNIKTIGINLTMTTVWSVIYLTNALT